MAALLRDLRYALRLLRRAPLFTLTAGVTLALGIGANTAVSSVVDAVLFRPLPVAGEDRLMKPVLTRRDRGGHFGVPYHNFVRWSEDNRTFSALAAVRERTYTLTTGDGDTERLAGTEVSPSFFEVLGVEPVLGRPFLPGEAVPGAGRVAVLGHALWQRLTGGDPEAVGGTITLDGEPCAVVGVMPPGAPSGITLVALAACALPARRAARVDPAGALRHE